MRDRLKLLMALLLVMPLAFAASEWVVTATGALLMSVGIIATIYMVGRGFNINELKLLANEEIYQTIMTAVMIGAFFAASAFFNEISDFLVSGSDTLQGNAASVVGTYLLQDQAVLGNLKAFAVTLGSESSKTSFCSLQGVGYNIAACSSFRALTSPLTLGLQAISVSISELSSLLTLLKFGKEYAFTLLLPLGILLRTLRFTRGAGGLLIGLAAALYFFAPLAVVTTKVILDDYAPSDFSKSPGSLGTGFKCEPAGDASTISIDTLTGPTFLENYDVAAGVFDDLRENVRSYTYAFLVQGTLTTIVALLALFAGMRAVGRLAGADADISALMRIV